jgi:hypothetical protein
VSVQLDLSSPRSAFGADKSFDGIGQHLLGYKIQLTAYERDGNSQIDLLEISAEVVTSTSEYVYQAKCSPSRPQKFL